MSYSHTYADPNTESCPCERGQFEHQVDVDEHGCTGQKGHARRHEAQLLPVGMIDRFSNSEQEYGLIAISVFCSLGTVSSARGIFYRTTRGFTKFNS